MTARLVAWTGPEPRRLENAQVALGRSGMTARGTSVTSDYALAWVLDAEADWATTSLAVQVVGAGWQRSLRLGRLDGRWSADREVDGAAAEALDVTGLDDALDCDLGLCPLTNTMPVRRHGLVEAARAREPRSVALTMAWVAVPELTLHVSEQRYSTIGPARDGGAIVGFASGDFSATIEFDRDGLVREYPGIASRLR